MTISNPSPASITSPQARLEAFAPVDSLFALRKVGLEWEDPLSIRLIQWIDRALLMRSSAYSFTAHTPTVSRDSLSFIRLIDELAYTLLVSPIDRHALREPVLAGRWVWEKSMLQDYLSCFTGIALPGCPFTGIPLSQGKDHLFAKEMLAWLVRYITPLIPEAILQTVNGGRLRNYSQTLSVQPQGRLNTNGMTNSEKIKGYRTLAMIEIGRIWDSRMVELRTLFLDPFHPLIHTEEQTEKHRIAFNAAVELVSDLRRIDHLLRLENRDNGADCERRRTIFQTIKRQLEIKRDQLFSVLTQAEGTTPSGNNSHLALSLSAMLSQQAQMTSELSAQLMRAQTVSPQEDAPDSASAAHRTIASLNRRFSERNGLSLTGDQIRNQDQTYFTAKMVQRNDKLRSIRTKLLDFYREQVRKLEAIQQELSERLGQSSQMNGAHTQELHRMEGEVTRLQQEINNLGAQV